VQGGCAQERLQNYNRPVGERMLALALMKAARPVPIR